MEPHRHKGIDGQQIDAQDIAGQSVYHEDWALSARGQTIIQQGPYTLAANKAFVAFPRYYVSASNLGTANLQVFLTSKTTNSIFFDSFATAVGGLVSGFTVSGTGSDTGMWMSIGYK